MRFLLASVFFAALSNGATIYTVVDHGPFDSAMPPGTPGTAANLGTLPGGSWSAAYGTNAAGDMAGYGDTGDGHFRAFLWTPSTGLMMLGTLGGADSWGMAINNSGEVAGHSTTSLGYINAFEWSGGQLENLGTLGGTSSYAYAINDAGVVVGSGDAPDGAMHAFASSGGGMVDLNALIPGGAGWLLTAAYGVDNQGRIFGVGQHDGLSREFELDPLAQSASSPAVAPEPSTLLLVAMTMALILGGARFGSGSAARRCLARQACETDDSRL